jgi:dimethylamine monooxygenase subunit A
MTAPRPVHTPYDGSAKPFTIGLKPLDPARWIEVDGELPFMLAEKARLDGLARERVFAAEPDTWEAQAEVLRLLGSYLPEHHGAIYSRTAGGIAVAGVPEAVAVADESLAPLLRAARLVADDLILMRRGAQGWRLVAASLSFPSSWSLGEKFGRPLHEIHAPVPGFGPGTRNAEVIARIFDRLTADAPVERWNWSVQADRRLFLPASHGARDATRGPRFPAPDPAAAAFIRVERQTLRRLPGCGDILFTVRIHLDPMAALEAHPERPTLAGSLARQLRALSADQVAYKGLAHDRDRLAEALERLAA